MRYLLALIFAAVGVVAVIAYNGTPHGGPTTECGPITIFNRMYTVNADCRYVSLIEIVVFLAFFLLALISLAAARPRPPGY